MNFNWEPCQICLVAIHSQCKQRPPGPNSETNLHLLKLEYEQTCSILLVFTGIYHWITGHTLFHFSPGGLAAAGPRSALRSSNASLSSRDCDAARRGKREKQEVSDCGYSFLFGVCVCVLFVVFKCVLGFIVVYMLLFSRYL